jgi:hypothetical protein
MTGALICRSKIDHDGFRASLVFPDHIAPDEHSRNSASWTGYCPILISYVKELACGKSYAESVGMPAA